MMSWVKLLGAAGGFCFAYCGVPLAYATAKAGKSLGTPVFTAAAIALGGILMYSYILLTFGFDPLLTVNYTVEVLSWLVVLLYHYFPRKV